MDEIDLLAIGAINIDYVSEVQSKPLISTDETERQLNKYDAIQRLNNSSWKYVADQPGGSAFNTARAVSVMGTDLVVKFVGTIGMKDGGKNIFDWIIENNISTDFIKTIPDERPGACFANLIEGGRRDLETSPFANEYMADWLYEIIEKYGNEISKSKIIHISSLLDDSRKGPCTPSNSLTNFVTKIKELNPGSTISFDPGLLWISQYKDSVKKILLHTDILFLNESELNSLSGEQSGIEIEKKIPKIFEMISNSSVVIILKHPDEVVYITKSRTSKKPLFQYLKSDSLPVSSLINPVGTGDALAAGFLAGKLLNLDAKESVYFGQDLARHKLQSTNTKIAEKQFSTILAERNMLAFKSRSRRWDSDLQLAASKFHNYALALRNHTRSDRNGVEIRDEYDVCYLLYAVLRSFSDEVRIEDPDLSSEEKASRSDFSLPNLGIVVECKNIPQTGRVSAKSILQNCRQKIHTYKHPNYKFFFLFIYDPYKRLNSPSIFNSLNGRNGNFEDVRVFICNSSV